MTVFKLIWIHCQIVVVEIRVRHPARLRVFMDSRLKGEAEASMGESHMVA